MRLSCFPPNEFPHRANKDGTMDSICPRCFATIGRATWEAELEKMEASHACDPVQLFHFEPVTKCFPDLRAFRFGPRAAAPRRSADLAASGR